AVTLVRSDVEKDGSDENVSLDCRRAAELHEDRASLPRAARRDMVRAEDRPHGAALRPEHVGCVFPRLADAFAGYPPGRWWRHSRRADGRGDDRLRADMPRQSAGSQ